jgi:hypothetical protein
MQKGKSLPLYKGAVACCRCGYCCKVRSCGFGEWDEKAHRCKELLGSMRGEYACGKYDEIVGSAGGLWKLAPAFGAGCCSTFNSDRAAVLRGI